MRWAVLGYVRWVAEMDVEMMIRRDPMDEDVKVYIFYDSV